MAGLVFPTNPVNGQQYPDPPIPGVNYYIYDAEATTWRLQSSGGTGTGTVTRIDTCSSLTGGPITTTGTLCLSNTGVTAGTYSYATVTVDTQGRITYAANGLGSPGAWTKTGTVITPTVVGDQVQMSQGTYEVPGLSFVGAPYSGFGSEASDSVYFAVGGRKSLTFDTHGAQFVYDGVFPPVWITSDSTALGVAEGFRMDSSLGDYTALSMGFNATDGIGSATTYLSLSRPVYGYNTNSLSFYASTSVGNAGALPNFVISRDGSINTLSRGPLRFYDANNSNYVALRSPDVVGTNVTWSLPSADGVAGQLLATAGNGSLYWYTVAGTGTVTSIATGTGLSGGPITTTGTISLNVATEFTLGGVRPDGDTIVIDSEGVISAPGAQNWVKVGTTLAPSVADDLVKVYSGDNINPGLSFIGTPGTGFGTDGGQTLFFATSGYKSVELNAQGLRLLSPTGSGIPLLITGTAAILTAQVSPGSNDLNIGFNNSDGLGSATTYFNSASRSLSLSIGGSSALVISTLGDVNILSQRSLRLYDTDNSNYVAFRSPAVVDSDVTWTLPAADGTVGQALTTNGTGSLEWTTVAGSGTVTSISTGTGLTGGPITTSGTISIVAATNSALGGVKPDGTSIVIQPDGTISAPGVQNWTRTGTVLSPTVVGDQIQLSPGTASSPGLAFTNSASTGFGSDVAQSVFFATNNFKSVGFNYAGISLWNPPGGGGSPLSIYGYSPSAPLQTGIRMQNHTGNYSALEIGFKDSGFLGEGTTVWNTSIPVFGTDLRSISLSISGSPVLVVTTDGNTNIAGQGSLRFYNANNTNYSALRSPDIGGNVTWTLPVSDGAAGQLLTTDGDGALGWVTADGSGTVTSINTGTGLTGGPITTTGTISIAAATTSALGGVKPDGTSIVIQPDGTISAPGAQNWTRTGTVLSPTVSGDQVQVSIGTVTAPGLSFVGNSGTGFGIDSYYGFFYAQDNYMPLTLSSSGATFYKTGASSVYPPVRITAYPGQEVTEGLRIQRISSGDIASMSLGFRTNGAFGEYTSYLSLGTQGFDTRSLSFYGSQSATLNPFSIPDLVIATDGSVRITSQHPLRFYDADNSNYVALQSAAAVSTNVTWTLPAVDGTSGQVLSTNGSGTLGWIAAGGTGTVTSLNISTGLTGGPLITTTGTIGLATATTSSLGGVKPDGTSITILPDGTISASGTQNWKRVGTVLSPTVTGDQTQVSPGTVTAPGLAFVGSPGVGFGSPSDAGGAFFTTGDRQVIDFNGYGLRVKANLGLPNLWIGGKDGSSSLTSQVISLQPTFNGGQWFNLGFETNPAPFGEQTAAIHTYQTGSSADRSISFRAHTEAYGQFPDLIIGTDGNTRLPQRKALRFYDADSSNYVGFSAPATVTANTTWSLPPADGGAGQVLTTDGAGNTSWTTKTTGASGTFVSQDGKTVTVTNGLITSIV